ncbi:MAG: hypothetical protein WA813_04465, partial [Beijerinckiaceae bacterium]
QALNVSQASNFKWPHDRSGIAVVSLTRMALFRRACLRGVLRPVPADGILCPHFPCSNFDRLFTLWLLTTFVRSSFRS